VWTRGLGPGFGFGRLLTLGFFIAILRFNFSLVTTAPRRSLETAISLPHVCGERFLGPDVKRFNPVVSDYPPVREIEVIVIVWNHHLPKVLKCGKLIVALDQAVLDDFQHYPSLSAPGRGHTRRRMGRRYPLIEGRWSDAPSHDMLTRIFGYQQMGVLAHSDLIVFPQRRPNDTNGTGGNRLRLHRLRSDNNDSPLAGFGKSQSAARTALKCSSRAS